MIVDSFDATGSCSFQSSRMDATVVSQVSCALRLREGGGSWISWPSARDVKSFELEPIEKIVWV